MTDWRLFAPQNEILATHQRNLSPYAIFAWCVIGSGPEYRHQIMNEAEAKRRSGSLHFTLVVVFLLCRGIGFSQGTFANMDFEHPITPLVPVDFEVPTTNAIPGWTAYSYGGPAGWVAYNTLSLGAAYVSLQGPGSREPIIQGSYTVYLQGSSGGAPSSAAVGQTGQIPIGTRSLLLWGSLIDISFNGQNLPIAVLSQTPNYLVVGADVSMLAGQTGELLFTIGAGKFGFLDNVQFSSSPIPEPAAFALFGFGGLFLGLGRRRFRAF